MDFLILLAIVFALIGVCSPLLIGVLEIICSVFDL